MAWSIAGLTALGLSAAAIVSAFDSTSPLRRWFAGQQIASSQQPAMDNSSDSTEPARGTEARRLVSQLTGEDGSPGNPDLEETGPATAEQPVSSDGVDEGPLGSQANEPAAMTIQQIAETNRRQIEFLAESVRLHDRRLLSLMDKLDGLSQEVAGLRSEIDRLREDSSQLTEQHLELERAQQRLLEASASFDKFIVDELPQIRRALGTRSETKASTAGEDNADEASTGVKSADRGLGTLVIDNQTERTISILVNGETETLQPGRNSFAVPIGDVRVEGENRSWLLDSGLWQNYRGQQVLYRDKWPL